MKITRVIAIFFFLAFILLNAEDKALIEDLERNLMAPCCWSNTVAAHGNSEIESSIREMVSQGLTRQQILDNFVEKYGEEDGMLIFNKKISEKNYLKKINSLKENG